jgi:hypothetical protein
MRLLLVPLLTRSMVRHFSRLGSRLVWCEEAAGLDRESLQAIHDAVGRDLSSSDARCPDPKQAQVNRIAAAAELMCIASAFMHHTFYAPAGAVGAENGERQVSVTPFQTVPV